MQTPEVTILSQYANSPTLNQIIEAFNQAEDPAVNFQSFYDNIWNLDTASGYGLDVWGRIVNVPRTVTIPNTPLSFGFYDGVFGDFAPFGQAPFVNGEGSTSNFELTDSVYLQLILLKAYANITGISCQTLNVMLSTFFGPQGRAYANDYGEMVMGFTFEFYLSAADVSIFVQSGAIPRPTGVQAYVYQLPPGATFGFAEAGPTNSAPFGQFPILSASAPLFVQQVASPPTAPLGSFVLGVNSLG
jgi:hypothetical protein